MNYVYTLLGTIFTMTLVAQMLAYAAFVKQSKVIARKSRNNQA